MKRRAGETNVQRVARMRARTAADLAHTTMLWALGLGATLAAALLQCIRQDWLLAVMFVCVAVLHYQMMRNSVRIERDFLKRAD